MSYISSYIADTIDIFYSITKPHNLTEDELDMITTSRIVCSAISIFACITILIFYAIMCVKFRCTKRRNSIARQISLVTPDGENMNSSLVFKDSNNYDVIVHTRYKSVFKSSRMAKNSEKMGIGNDLIFFLILSNLGWCIGTFFGPEGYNSEEDKLSSACIAQAFIQNFFDISSVCFTMLISRVTLLGTTKSYADFSKSKYRMCLFLLYATLFPLALTLGPLLTDSLGCSGAWCWIDLFNMNYFSYLWTISIYIFDWSNILYIIYALIVATKYFEKRKSEIFFDPSKKKELKFLQKYVLILKAFPILLIVNRLPGIVNRAYSLLFKEDSFCLFMIHSIAIALSGLSNSLIYSFFYRSIFKCCKRNKENLPLLESENNNELKNGINSHY